MRVSTLSLLLGLTACAGADTPSGVAVPRQLAGDPVTIARFRSGGLPYAIVSGYQSATRTVIRDDATWAAAWSQLHQHLVPEPPRPAVDFATDMVVLAALGQRSTGGHTVLVEQAAEENGAISVLVVATAPGARCVVTQMVTEPVDLVRLPRNDQPVQFVTRQDIADCP